MSSIKIDVFGDKKHVREQLRALLRGFDDNPLTTWRWWSGFLLGAVFVSLLDYGDVWICVGACGDNAPQSVEHAQ